jgi:hypothetical protein
MSEKTVDLQPGDSMTKLVTVQEYLRASDRPLVLMIPPDRPDEVILLWKGLALGAIESISLTVTKGKVVVRIMRHTPSNLFVTTSEVAEKAWDEMAAAGIQIEERN